MKKFSRQTEKIDTVHSKLARLLLDEEVTWRDINLLTSTVSQFKNEMKNLEHTYIQIKTPPLMIVDTMLQITETIRPKIDLSTLSPTCQSFRNKFSGLGE
jgi:hypothetical protein